MISKLYVEEISGVQDLSEDCRIVWNSSNKYFVNILSSTCTKCTLKKKRNVYLLML